MVEIGAAVGSTGDAVMGDWVINTSCSVGASGGVRRKPLVLGGSGAGELLGAPVWRRKTFSLVLPLVDLAVTGLAVVLRVVVLAVAFLAVVLMVFRLTAFFLVGCFFACFPFVVFFKTAFKPRPLLLGWF